MAMEMEIKDINDFRLWVNIELAKQQTTKTDIAKRLGIAYPRFTEAVNGHKYGARYRAPLIKALGGNVEDFKCVLSDVKPALKKGS
ncbi:MAG: XRE family transcriptional regulator [Christensenella sp.]